MLGMWPPKQPMANLPKLGYLALMEYQFKVYLKYIGWKAMQILINNPNDNSIPLTIGIRMQILTILFLMPEKAEIQQEYAKN